MATGNDEHGPAYPEPPYASGGYVKPPADGIPTVITPGEYWRNTPSAEYRCPICNGGENRYMTCEYPGCPDGRDQSRFAMLRATYEPEPDVLSGVGKALGWVVVLILLAYLLSH